MKNLENDLSENLEIEKNVTPEKQNSFLETNIGKAANFALDIGIKYIMPDCIENEIIEIKDNFISEGFENGVKTAVNSAIELGKNILGIFNGNFTDINQAEKAVEKGGLIDGISNVLDFVLDKIEDKGILNKNITNVIKDGKNYLLDSIEDRIKDNFKTQVSSVDNINTYIEEWNNHYSNKDINMMDKTYEKIQDELGEVMPLESVIKTAKEIENIQTLVKNNNGNFELSNEQIELSKILI